MLVVSFEAFIFFPTTTFHLSLIFIFFMSWSLLSIYWFSFCLIFFFAMSFFCLSNFSTHDVLLLLLNIQGFENFIAVFFVQFFMNILNSLSFSSRVSISIWHSSEPYIMLPLNVMVFLLPLFMHGEYMFEKLQQDKFLIFFCTTSKFIMHFNLSSWTIHCFKSDICGFGGRSQKSFYFSPSMPEYLV